VCRGRGNTEFGQSAREFAFLSLRQFLISVPTLTASLLVLASSTFAHPSSPSNSIRLCKVPMPALSRRAHVVGGLAHSDTLPSLLYVYSWLPALSLMHLYCSCPSLVCSSRRKRIDVPSRLGVSLTGVHISRQPYRQSS
jgi:hypothetical protein